MEKLRRRLVTLTFPPLWHHSPHHTQMNFDMSHLLQRWDYRPGEVMVRKIKGRDGTLKLQLRVDLGILQMNLDGRPDGKKPNGFPSFYDFLLRRLDDHVAKNGGDETFKLPTDSCTRLHLEALQYHHRYICLLQLEEFDAVERDSMRNLAVFDFAARYASTPELAWSLQQFRPQSIMILTRARATPLIRRRRQAKAVAEIESGIRLLNEFYDEVQRPDLQEQSIEVESLQNWLNDLRAVTPSRRRPSRREQLESQLSEAVQREDYEKAARVRDLLRNLRLPGSK